MKMIKVPPEKVSEFLMKWLKPIPLVTNIDKIYCPELIGELIELKEQKNGNFKEKTKPTQE